MKHFTAVVWVHPGHGDDYAVDLDMYQPDLAAATSEVQKVLRARHSCVMEDYTIKEVPMPTVDELAKEFKKAADKWFKAHAAGKNAPKAEGDMLFFAKLVDDDDLGKFVRHKAIDGRAYLAFIACRPERETIISREGYDRFGFAGKVKQ